MATTNNARRVFRKKIWFLLFIWKWKQKITKESEKKKLIEEARENDEYFIDDDIKGICDD